MVSEGVKPYHKCIKIGDTTNIFWEVKFGRMHGGGRVVFSVDYVSIISEFFEEGFAGRLVEIGANDGMYHSNSRHLLEAGWSGLLVEPNPLAYGRLLRNTAGMANVETLHMGCWDSKGELDLWVPSVDLDRGGLTSTFVSEWMKNFYVDAGSEGRLNYASPGTWTNVPVDTVAALHPAPMDLLMVDAEGGDLKVLAGVDWELNRPRLVLCGA